MYTRDAELLFHKYDMFGVLDVQRRAIVKKVDALREAQVSADGTLKALVDDLKLEVPSLDERAISVSPPREVEINFGRGDFYDDYGRGRRAVKGTEVIFTVPFAGDHNFFFVRPTQFDLNPPRAIVETKAILVPFRAVQIIPEQVKSEFEATLKSINKYLSTQINDVASFNENLEELVAQALASRGQKLKQATDAVNAFGYPVKG